MNEQKLKTVQQWRTALQEAARTAVEALAFETPINKAVPSLDERSEIIGAAIHKIRELVRPEGEPGTYFTPKAAIDVVMANPPIGGKNEKPFTTASLASIPELNIEFHQYHTKDYYKFICWWHNEHELAGRVYELTVKPGDAGDFWYANALAGGKPLFSLGSHSKRLAIECGLMAMRRYLIRGHRAALTTWRRAEAAKQQADDNKTPRVAPLSPEEELADTIKRQKEAEAL